VKEKNLNLERNYFKTSMISPLLNDKVDGVLGGSGILGPLGRSQSSVGGKEVLGPFLGNSGSGGNGLASLSGNGNVLRTCAVLSDLAEGIGKDLILAGGWDGGEVCG
jgi:hypothetical protein